MSANQMTVSNDQDFLFNRQKIDFSGHS